MVWHGSPSVIIGASTPGSQSGSQTPSPNSEPYVWLTSSSHDALGWPRGLYSGPYARGVPAGSQNSRACWLRSVVEAAELMASEAQRRTHFHILESTPSSPPPTASLSLSPSAQCASRPREGSVTLSI
eukprot:scaffold306054_cov31-Tisochrysis_lutea.AAC.1